jgi:hypothetical protein
MWTSARASRSKLFLPVLLAVVLMAPAAANAKIDKKATLGKNGIRLYWWPDLAHIKGWHHEDGASMEYGVNAEAPDGYTFSNAVAVIYAEAIYKPREPETKSLAMFIKNDKASFLAKDPAIEITEVDPLKTADGRSLATYTYFPAKEGNWEEVSYGEEGDYYLVFVISSRTRPGFEKALPVYEGFIREYK